MKTWVAFFVFIVVFSEHTTLAASPQCIINLTTPNIWLNTLPWNQRSDIFRDKTASWMMAKPSFVGANGLQCPQGDPKIKYVYLSTFQVTAGGEHFVELLADDAATVRFWKNFSPQQEVFSMSSTNVYRSQTTPLNPGVYTVIVEHIDNGVTGAAVFSLQSANGAVVKNTAGDDTWSALEYPIETNVVAAFTR